MILHCGTSKSCSNTCPTSNNFLDTTKSLPHVVTRLEFDQIATNPTPHERVLMESTYLGEFQAV